MVERAEFEELCTLVAELADHVRRASIGTQGWTVDEQVTELARRVEELRDKPRAG